jgi:hypothetical protein
MSLSFNIMTNHLITHRIGATCRMPPDHPVGDECHIVGTSMYCALHCVVCHPPPEPKKNLKQERQRELFVAGDEK